MSDEQSEMFAGEEPESLEVRVTAEEKQLIAYEELRDAFSHVFTTPQGATVLAYLAREYRLHARVDLAPGPVDPYRMAFEQGQRSVITDIVQRIAENIPNLTLPPN